MAARSHAGITVSRVPLMADELKLRPPRIRRERLRRGGHRFSRRIGLPGSNFRHRSTRECMQRSIVKVAYVKNVSGRVWAAHGRYLEREGAQRQDERGVGFDAVADDRSLATAVRDGQEGGDALVWKLVVSPEQAHRMDLRAHTRSLMKKVSEALETRVEWVAIEHQNTDNPHVHILMRGRHENGSVLEIDPEFIKHGFRATSIELATNELGYRTQREHRAALEKEVTALRLTSLDREGFYPDFADTPPGPVSAFLEVSAKSR
jgi:type IV secretory pathway VirD2 relaxase